MQFKRSTRRTALPKMELMMKKGILLHDKITSTRWIILRSTLIIYIRIFQGQGERSTRLM